MLTLRGCLIDIIHAAITSQAAPYGIHGETINDGTARLQRAAMSATLLFCCRFRHYAFRFFFRLAARHAAICRADAADVAAAAMPDMALQRHDTAPCCRHAILLLLTRYTYAFFALSVATPLFSLPLMPLYADAAMMLREHEVI